MLFCIDLCNEVINQHSQINICLRKKAQVYVLVLTFLQSLLIGLSIVRAERSATKAFLILVFLLNDWRWLRDVLAEDVTLDDVWKPHGQLVADELPGRNREDLCAMCQ